MIDKVNVLSTIVLDYSGADADGLDKQLKNISGIALDGDKLWTVSDERARIECLIRSGDGFVFHQQLRLSELFPNLPEGKEADLESVAVVDGRVWVLGSHCRVRGERDEGGPVDPLIKPRDRRNLFGTFEPAGAATVGVAQPFTGDGSLRRILREDPFLKPFLEIPSKENGFDLEGLAILDGSAFLGCRGPVIDGLAIIIELPLANNLPADDAVYSRHFIDLNGLGVRDLARDGDKLIILAGPTMDAPGPYRIYSWSPAAAGDVAQAATPLLEWELPMAEKPEGIACFGGGQLIVVYDSPAEWRLGNSALVADIITRP